MAISLNDHERRIVELENKQSKIFKRVTLFSGEVYPDHIVQLNQSMLNFDIIRFIFRGTDGISSVIPNQFTLDVYTDEIQDTNIRSVSVTGDLSSCAIIHFNDRDSYTSCQAVSGGSPYGEAWYLNKVVGILTIYYIVRYNIYKLVQFLSHLNTKIWR